MGKDCKYGGEPLLFLAAAVAAELAHGKNSRELFEMGKFMNLIKENLYVLADKRLNWPDPVKKPEKDRTEEDRAATAKGLPK